MNIIYLKPEVRLMLGNGANELLWTTDCVLSWNIL